MGRRRQRSFWSKTLGIAVALTGGVLGCHQRVYVSPGPDGAVDGGGNDGMAPLTLDIAVTGCERFNNTAPVACTGTAPLAVSFSPVGSPALTSFLWTFGDGTSSSPDRAPAHTYTLPGSYNVNVTGGGTVGTVSQLRLSLIVVQAVATGAPCDVDGQCDDGLHCLCQPGTGCRGAFLRGICTTACATGFCGAGASCAAYAPGSPADGGAIADAGAARDSSLLPSPSLCLATCQADGDCSAGFVCETLPAGGSTSANWVRGCLPLGAAGDLGASCRNANGDLDGTRCTTGLCADVGTLGICSAACDAGNPCPSNAGCARLHGGLQFCLTVCSTKNPCTRDPSLQCKVGSAPDAGTDGGTSFRIVGGDAGASYCAPS